MESQLTEAGTFPAQIYAESFFANIPTDARFLQCTYQKFMPSSSIDGKTIEFNLDRYDAANVYLIQDTNIEVNFTITKADGTLPDTESADVSIANNFLHLPLPHPSKSESKHLRFQIENLKNSHIFISI